MEYHRARIWPSSSGCAGVSGSPPYTPELLPGHFHPPGPAPPTARRRGWPFPPGHRDTDITSLRRPKKVSIFGEKAASMPPGHPGGENLWAMVFRLIVGERTRNFRLLLG